MVIWPCPTIASKHQDLKPCARTVLSCARTVPFSKQETSMPKAPLERTSTSTWCSGLFHQPMFDLRMLRNVFHQPFEDIYITSTPHLDFAIFCPSAQQITSITHKAIGSRWETTCNVWEVTQPFGFPDVWLRCVLRWVSTWASGHGLLKECLTTMIPKKTVAVVVVVVVVVVVAVVAVVAAVAAVAAVVVVVVVVLRSPGHKPSFFIKRE